MRVLHLLDTEEFAGTEIHLLALANELNNLGVKAEIACAPGSRFHEAAQNSGLTVWPVLTGGYVKRLKQLRRILQQDFDLVHAHNGRTLILAALNKVVPAVATQHFIAPASATYRGLKKRVVNLAHRHLNKRIARFIAISQAAKNAMLLREGVNPDKVAVIPNGIPAIAFPNEIETTALYEELGIHAETPIVVCVARLDPEKGIKYLIEAVPRMLEEFQDLCVLLVGEGTIEKQLRELICRLKIENSVRILGFRQDAKKFIGIANVFVLPSPEEPFGLVLLEAMSQGVPVVAVASGGPMEIIENGHSGLLVRPCNPDDLAQGIQKLLLDSSLRNRLGQAGKQRFEERFTCQQMAQATKEVYLNVHQKYR